MSILKRPLLSEKNQKFEKSGTYGFEVDIHANKPEIGRQIEKLYQVNVVRVNTLILAGKAKTKMVKGRAMVGRTKRIKKAYITLQEGQIIDLYSDI